MQIIRQYKSTTARTIIQSRSILTSLGTATIIIKTLINICRKYLICSLYMHVQHCRQCYVYTNFKCILLHLECFYLHMYLHIDSHPVAKSNLLHRCTQMFLASFCTAAHIHCDHCIRQYLYESKTK